MALIAYVDTVYGKCCKSYSDLLQPCVKVVRNVHTYAKIVLESYDAWNYILGQSVPYTLTMAHL